MVYFRLATVAAALLAAGASALTPVPPTTTTGPTTKAVPTSKYGKYGMNGRYMQPTAAPVTTKAYKYVAPKAYPHAEEKCTALKERCAGAPGKPYVQYIGCCGDAECVEKPEMGWGRFCTPKPEPKCHSAGQRCAGAEGYEYVEYLGCCGDAVCTTDPSMGWGSFCKPGKTYDYEKYPAYTMAPTTTAPAKKYGYGYYPKATTTPTTAPPKKYGYGYYPKATMAPTMAPTKKYGYGYSKKTAGSSAWTAFGPSFGCGESGMAPVNTLATSLQQDLTDVSAADLTAIIQLITVAPPADDPHCTVNAATFPAEDAQAILDSLCATANGAGDVASCQIITVVDSAQGAGVDITFEIVVATDDAVAVLTAIAAVLPAGQVSPVIGTGPEVTPE